MLRGRDLGATGGGSDSIQMVTGSLLLVGRRPGGPPDAERVQQARRARRSARVKLPAAGQYGMMSYMHEGKQYVVVQIGGAQYPGSLVALTLPE